LPATALVSLEKKDVLDCSRPLSKVSFFSEENILLKKDIAIVRLFGLLDYSKNAY